MQPIDLLHETPRQRLLRLESYSSPFRSTARSPIYLTGLGLLLLLLTMIIAGILLVTVGSGLLGPHIEQIEKMASPFWR